MKLKFKHIVDGALLGNVAAGLECRFTDIESCVYIASKSIRKEDEVDVVDSVETADTKELVEFIGAIPVMLCVTGKATVTKKGHEDEFGQLTGMEPTSATLNSYPSEGDVWTVAISNERLESILRELTELGMNIVHVSLGGIALLQHAHLLVELPLRVGEHNYEWEERRLTNYRFNHTAEIRDFHESTTVFGLPLNTCLSTLASISYFGFSRDELSKDTESRISDFVFKKLRKKAGIGFIGFILLLLLLNYFVLNHERDVLVIKNQELSSLLERTDAVAKQSEWTENLSRLYHEIAFENYYYSKISDQLASVLPEGISLLSLEIRLPTVERNGSRNDAFQEAVLIVGKSDGIGEIQELMKRLSGFEWISQTSLESIDNLPEGGSQFKIECKL